MAFDGMFIFVRHHADLPVVGSLVTVAIDRRSAVRRADAGNVFLRPAVRQARQARQNAAKALAAYAARPVAPTCAAAIVELSDALGGRQ